MSPEADAGDELVDRTFAGERFIGADYERTTALDCAFDDCDLSAARFREATLHRVRFTRCRLSATTFAGAKLHEVTFVECKLDDANFRMTIAEKVAFEDCVLTAADFYAASFPDAKFVRCDLREAEFSKATMHGTHILGARLDGIKGAIDMSGITIDGAEMIPLALSMFAALGIALAADDDDADRVTN